MKKIFIGIGLSFGALFILIALIFGVMAYKGSRLDASSLAFVKETVPKILTGWNRDALVAIESDAMALYGPKEKVDRLFSIFSQALGHFHHMEEPVGESMMHADSSGTHIGGSYKVKAQFEKGWAEISMVLIFENDKWLVNSFNINSPLLGPFEAEMKAVSK